MKLTWILLGIGLLFLINTASADIYLGYEDSDFYFEIYSGNNYSYVNTPYSYAYDDYYYFDYPYRVYSYGDYYNFDAGWYSYDDSWRFAPDYGSYYSYYPTNYYYYDNYWTFEPDWINLYAPSYYGSYYYPHSYSDYYPTYSDYSNTYYYGNTGYYETAYYEPIDYLGPYYGVGEPTLTGQDYQPRQEASCGQITLNTTTVSIRPNETKKVSFYLNNNSVKYLDVDNVSVYVNGYDLEATQVKFDRTINNHSNGKVEFNLTAGPRVNSGTTTATINTSASFRDGTRCGFSDLEQRFNINVSGANTIQQTTIDCRYDNSPYCNSTGSTAYTEAKETQQKWREVETTPTVYSEPVIVEPIKEPVQLKATNCTGLRITPKNMVMDSGKTDTEYFTFRNYGQENFNIDQIEGITYSPDFAIEATRDSTIINKGQTTTLKVKALASETEKDTTGTGYVKVMGHFDSGFTCELTSENFYVRVNGFKEEQGLDKVKLHNPAKVEVSGNSGFVELKLDNPTDEAITVQIYSNNATVSPKKFTINANSFSERIVAVNNLNSEEAIVYFDVQSEGREFLQKYTKLMKVAQEPFEIEVPEPQYNEPETQTETEETNTETEEEGTLQGMTGFVSTGMAILHNNSFTLGAIILGAIGLLFLFGRQE